MPTKKKTPDSEPVFAVLRRYSSDVLVRDIPFSEIAEYISEALANGDEMGDLLIYKKYGYVASVIPVIKEY